jgi:serine/threonine protein kinase
VIGVSVGNFEIVSPLGKGGMGEVWLAVQKTVKTNAAIKILAASISNNKTHVDRFFNEAVAVGKIPHSGIVKIFDCGVLPDGRAYLVMEYLQGETLASRIKRMGRLEMTQLCDFGRQIASVLDATHGAGITHRDLKPENIFLVRDAELQGGERVKVLDFGIAKLDTTVGPRMTAAGASSIGTPNYMSPEQWHSLADADWRTDAYALGCVAFEMACGRPPFVAESRVEVCAMHLGEPPPVPSSIRPQLTPPFDILVARLLDKEPSNRPNMREVIGTFTALGETIGMMLTTLSPKGVMSPFAKRPEDSMQYKVTPRAGFTSQTDLPKMTDETIEASDSRTDATPVANMSMQFRATPRAGFQSQHDMPVQTDRPSGPGMRPSQPLQMKAAKPRRIGLYIGGVAVVIATAVIAVLATRSPSTSSAGSASGSAIASGSAVASGSAPETGSSRSAGSAETAGSGSGSAIVAVVPRPSLPALLTGGVPELETAVDLEVCINRDGEVLSVTLANGAPPDRVINAAVSAWQYEKQAKEDRLCGPVTLPAHKPKVAGGLPEKLTEKLFEDSLAEVNEGIFECVSKQTKSGVFTINIVVKPAGTVDKVNWARGAVAPQARFKACIEKVVRGISFAPTRKGGRGSTTIELN